eukprot:UN25333
MPEGGSLECSSEIIGDPIPQVCKACWCAPAMECDSFPEFDHLDLHRTEISCDDGPPFRNGATCAYSCEIGYKYSGVLTCLNGNWDRQVCYLHEREIEVEVISSVGLELTLVSDNDGFIEIAQDVDDSQNVEFDCPEKSWENENKANARRLGWDSGKWLKLDKTIHNENPATLLP